MRGSTTIYRSSADATDARSPSLAGKTAFFGNTRGVNGPSVCLGDSGRDTSAEHSVSSAVANARDCGIGYEGLAACRNGLGRFGKSYRREDSDCGIDCDKFAARRSGCGKFIKSYRRGDSGCGIGYDEFAAYRNGLGKFTKSYRRGDCIRFRCICDGCTAA
jgi:hypothetical protein